MKEDPIAINNINYTLKSFEDIPLFSDNIDETDAFQGRVGDCTLVAVAATIAYHRPEHIRSLIEKTGDNYYTARFYLYHWFMTWFKFKSKVEIDSDLYMDGSKLVYGRSDKEHTHTSLSELWFPLLEKAYAKHFSNYYDIEGLGAQKTLSKLTGRWASHYEMKSADRIKEVLTEIEVNRYPGIAATIFKENLPKESGIVGHHAYSILGYRNNQVILRNPWGFHEPQAVAEPNFINDGIFRYPFELFMKNFRGVVVSRMKQ